jgi:hypothetical protein
MEGKGNHLNAGTFMPGELGYGGYGHPDAVVTTRRVVAPDPMLEGNDILTTPSRYRRVVRGATVVAPGFLPARAIVASDCAGRSRHH